MTKSQAIAEWIEDVYNNQTGNLIVENDGQYYVTGHRLKEDTVCYTYPMFVYSNANLEIEDIANRF